MKAAVLEQIGEPLSIRELELPALRFGQVLVKVLCAGICGSQLQEIDGTKGDPTYLPHLLGHEGCGVVQEIGLGVTHVRCGDKVVMHWRKGAGADMPVGGIFNKITSGPITTFSEWSIVSENRVTKIDDDVSDDFACLLGCALSTALSLVEKEANIMPETTVFVIGCGGLGLALIVALKAAGVKNVVGHDICARKHHIVKELGAEFLFNQASGFDLVLDTTGNYKYLATGRYISLQKGGSEGGGFQPAKDIPRYVQMWRDGKLDDYSKLITRRIKLDQINEGIRLMREGRAGRVLIDMDSPEWVDCDKWETRVRDDYARISQVTADALIAFESGVKASWESGFLPSLIHLCGGNENELIEIFSEIKEGDWIFSTHRTHYHALMAGVDPTILAQKISDGDSMFIYSKERNFLCSAVLAGCAGIAAGVAWQLKSEWMCYTDKQQIARSKNRAWCFIGDGGEEEGHFYEAAMFVEANDLPCTFIIEDNNRSVDTSRESRRGNAKGLEHLFKCVRRYHYAPTYPHAGSGCNFKIEFDKKAIERHKRR